MINRTTGGYFVMMVVCGALLWGVLHVGGNLQAPPDVSGNWTVIGKIGRQAVVQQSGVFVVLTVDQETPQKYHLDPSAIRQNLTKTDAGLEFRLSPYRLWRETKDASQ